MAASVCQTLVRGFFCIAVIASAVSAAAQSISLPGTIQIEDFDQGAAGFAYYDQDAVNEGGQYRATGVDIEACEEGGFNVGWVRPGEWLKYTVNVSQSGVYALEFRVSSRHAGGTFHVEVNGVDRTGPINVPWTGGWQEWTTVTRSGVNLSAGSQTWRLVIDGAGDEGNVGNFNYIRVSGSSTSGGGGASASSTPYGGTAAILPGTVQLENFDNGGEGVAYHDLSNGNDGGQYRSSAVDIEVTSDTGGGYNVAYTYAREWLAYTVNVAATGTYDVDMRVASEGAGGTFHIEVNGVNKTGSLAIPNTGGWQNWITVRKTGVTLSGGQQVFKVVMETDGATTFVGNFNYMRVIASTTSGSSSGSGSSGSAGPTPYTGIRAALPGTLQAEDFDNGGEGVGYHDLDGANSGGAYRSTGADIEPTSDAGGGYNVGWAAAGEWLSFSVNLSTSGTYDIEARVASSGSGGTFHIEINGVDRTGPFTVPDSGGWQSWVTIRKTGLSLTGGQQLWRLVMDRNGGSGTVGNFNYFRVTAPGSSGGSGGSGSGGSGSGSSGSGSSTIPTNLVFTASADHATLVTSYSVALYRSSDPSTASPSATKNLGKPTPVGGEITQSISDIVDPLSSGSYYAIVTAIGSGGSSRSSPSGTFTK